ncbi:MAG: RNA-binding transcriptional accessory protein [Phycisphaerae bacterium]|nr:RNA-binding transcriptional accessory protein [Phycisphaerae bacterium]
MNQTHIELIAAELAIKTTQVHATAALFADGATVPFISRYRKEATGSLDEVAVTKIRDRLTQLAELDQRREAILKSLEERNLLSDDLKDKIVAAQTMTEVEDIYLPFRPKRRTRATIAKEKGLEPLAELLFAQDVQTNPDQEALAFVDAEKGVESAADALAGASDIIAEWVNESLDARNAIRKLYFDEGAFVSKVIMDKEADGIKYKDYYDWTEPVRTAPSHRVLAMRRGEKEGFLLLRVTAPEEKANDILRRMFVKNDSAAARCVEAACADGYKRLLSPSMETEVRLATKQAADEEAVRVFAENLRQLLLAAPLGEKNVMAVDPGFRTGCKLVCLDRQGKLLFTDVIYPHQGERQAQSDGIKVAALCQRFQIEAIAVGNGTAGRETEAFFRTLGLPASITIVMVNESGASIYSASDVAREEFPDYDLTVRGAVSIGRRLTDPLAELVKIDPKSIGVGQYQHDVDQMLLKQGLDDVVVSCVNSVGVEVNTASRQLLTYVSGLGPQLARNIVEYRNANGPFRARGDLLSVQRLGAKAFEQAAGFLRIRGAANPLDASAVHPERYPLVDRMAADVGCTVADLVKDEALRKKIDIRKYVAEDVGLPTLSDIVTELAKPGRDPRQQFEVFQFAEGIDSIEKLCEGMKLPGIVTNITKFGAFVDVGVHQDGLVHISQLANRYVADPADVVKVHQKVSVTVLEVDLARKRIALSMKEPAAEEAKPKADAAPRRSGPAKPQKPAGPRPGDKPRPGQKPAPKKDEPFGMRLFDNTNFSKN